MTTLSDLRDAALALPEVTEGTHFGLVAFFVRSKGFASVTKDDELQLMLNEDEANAALEEYPSGERVVRMGTPIGIRAPLADIHADHLKALVYYAWKTRAPKRLIDAVE